MLCTFSILNYFVLKTVSRQSFIFNVFCFKNNFQAVSQFSSALESGQLGPVVSQLAVNPEAVAAASQGNMQEFVKALQKAQEKKDGKKDDDNKDKPKDGKKDDDEEMQLD